MLSLQAKYKEIATDDQNNLYMAIETKKNIFLIVSYKISTYKKKTKKNSSVPIRMKALKG